MMRLKIQRLKLLLALNSAFSSVNCVNFRNVGTSNTPYSIFLENNRNLRKKFVVISQEGYCRRYTHYTQGESVTCTSGSDCTDTPSGSVHPDQWKITTRMEEGLSQKITPSTEEQLCQKITPSMEKESCQKITPSTEEQSCQKITPSMEEKSCREETCGGAALYSDVERAGWRLSSEEFLKFPLDPVKENYVRRNVPNAVFSIVPPTPLEGETVLAAVSPSALDLLDLDPSVASSTRFRELVCGSWIHPDSTPLAHRYGGHQFGWWAEQLGDGRAHLLGHYVNRHGSWWEIQLKGSGATPYSRLGDGRAVVRSSVREFLGAEAMHALGVRTSRSASLVVGEETVARDPFYSGHVRLEPTAIVARLAQSWFRFGSFEILARKGETEALKQLLNHILTRHFPDIDPALPDSPLALLTRVVEETAEMIAQWQGVGFTHGVMNTDNMSILSVTIDYGPFGFLETYNPGFVPNSSDDDGRYSYDNQPKIGYMNLRMFASALRPMLTQTQVTQIQMILDHYDLAFKEAYLKIFTGKLGLLSSKPEDEKLVDRLLAMMKETKADFTLTFWELGNVSLDELETKKFPKSFWALTRVANSEKFKGFVELYRARILDEGRTDEDRRNTMTSNNPRYVLRNWVAQQVIEEVERGNYQAVGEALKILQDPYRTHSEAEDKGWAGKAPSWANKLRVSCSS